MGFERTEGNKTATRQFYVEEWDGIFRVTYRPLNPKTETPWQAYRTPCTELWDCYRLGKGNFETAAAIVVGPPPAFEQWSKEWSSCYRGFSTRELAVAVMETLAGIRYPDKPLPNGAVIGMGDF